MKKFYKLCFLLLACSVGIDQSFAQRTDNKVDKSDLKKWEVKKINVKNFSQSGIQQNELQCILANPLPQGADLDIYGNQTFGLVTGTNTDGDKQKANYFDLSQSGASLLGGFRTVCYVDVPDDSKTVTWRVFEFDETNKVPGTELGNGTITLKALGDSSAKGSFNTIVMPTPIVLPASKKIFISFDYSNLDISNGELFAIFSTSFGQPYNLAWEQWSDDTWHSFAAPETKWNDSMVLAILPIICNDVVTPVKLSSFSANRFGTANKLTWTTASEDGSKGFEVQRSADGVNFTTIAFVPTQAIGGNSNSTLNYSYADNSVLPNNNYYRIKQVDVTSKATFTKTLLLFTDKLKKEGIVQAYPNPVKSNLNLVLDLGASKNNTLTVVDLAGRTLLQKAVQGGNGNQTTTLNVANLAKGTYFVKLTGEGNNKLVKFVKE